MVDPEVVWMRGFPAHRVEAARAILERLSRSASRGRSASGEDRTVAPSGEVTLETSNRRIEALCEVSGLTLGDGAAACSGRHVGQACRLRRRWIVDLAVRFDRPIAGSWEVVARIGAIDWGSDNLIQVLPGVRVEDGDLARWRAGTIGCDHCRVDRDRHDVVVLRALDDSVMPRGSLRGVGRTCLEVATGSARVEDLLARIGSPEQVWQAGDDGRGGWGEASAIYPVEEVVTVSAAIVRADGYRSRAKAREDPQGGAATADRVLRVIGHVSILEGRAAPGAGDVDVAREAIGWALTEDESDRSDYRNNLRVLAGAAYVGAEHVGMLASLVVAHGRALGDRAMRGPSSPLGAGSHVGRVGEVIDLEVVVERRTRSGSIPGMHVIRMRDDDGRSIVWRTTSDAVGKEGNRVRIRGRVRAHSEFHGEMQTELTRCRVSRPGGRPELPIDSARIPVEDEVD